MPLTIVHVWRYKYTNECPVWGIGDVLRGILKLKDFCASKGLVYELDSHAHAIGPYLASGGKTRYSHDLDLEKEPVYAYDNLRDIAFQVKKHWLSNKVLFVHTNAHDSLSASGISEATLEWAREALRLRPDVEAHFDRVRPKEAYEILHVRTGDPSAFSFGDPKAVNMDLVHKFLWSYNRPMVLCTDNQRLRDWAKIFAPKMNLLHNLSPIHSGAPGGAIEGTLLDMHLFRHASHIDTWSAYWWNSGFVTWTALIYKVPVKRVVT